MNDQHPNEDTTGSKDSENEAPRSESRDAFEDLGRAMKRAWKAGAEDAQRKAKEAVPKAKEEFSRGLHDLAWGISYVANFGAAIAREFTPETMNKGWDQGADAGREAGESFAEKHCRKKEAGEPENEPPADPENLPVPV